MKKVNNICMNIEEIKKQDRDYLIQSQKFFDLVDNIQDEDLKKNIIYQKLKCDKVLEELILKYINSQKNI